MNYELISVIVPVYNCERYVRQTLDSIVNQTYENLEILIIDDGSTDDSPAICDEYTKDSRVKVFHRQNAGVAASRQFGIDNCNGAYFVTLDSDDYVSADYVERLYRVIKKNDADISVCGVSCFQDGNPSTGSGTSPSTGSGTSEQVNLHVAYMPDYLDDKLVITPDLLATDFYRISLQMLLTDSWNKMHRTQFVRDSGVRYILEKKYTGPELQFEHRLALHCPVYCVCRELLLFHRNRAGSLVQRKDKPLQEGFEIIMESIIEETRHATSLPKEQLANIYYGLMGMVVWDHICYCKSVKERHAKFKELVRRNKRFLGKHRTSIDTYKGGKTFRVSMSMLTLPAFTLNSALWLDVVSWCYLTLRKLKYSHSS